MGESGEEVEREGREEMANRATPSRCRWAALILAVQGFRGKKHWWLVAEVYQTWERQGVGSTSREGNWQLGCVRGWGFSWECGR